MSLLCSTADAVRSGSWPILFKVQTLNVTVCIVCLHFSNICCLSSVADFRTRRPGHQPQQDTPRFTCAKSDAVYVCGLSVGHGYLSMAVFILNYSSDSYRGAAVVPRLNWRSWALSRVSHTSRTRTRIGIAFGRQKVYSHTFTSIQCVRKKN